MISKPAAWASGWTQSSVSAPLLVISALGNIGERSAG
jgi:hypothetical protein